MFPELIATLEAMADFLLALDYQDKPGVQAARERLIAARDDLRKVTGLEP